MVSHAIDVPAGGNQVQRCAQADRSFERRAFVATLIAVSIAISITFCAVYMSMRTQVKAEAIRSLEENQKSWDRARAGRNERESLALRLIAANPALRSSMVHATMDQVSRGFLTALPLLGLALVLLAFGLATSVSRVLSRPLHRLVARLEQIQTSGGWEADFPEDSATREVNLLAAAINRAATAVAHSNEQLDQAALDFVETMTQALDARDRYTAGHSKRVSEYATAIAVTMGLSPVEIETIRWGARLHDIGKIGISDSVLSKPGHLTPEEYEMIKLHPQIGRKILERMAAFEQYLPFVELHHEDFDGQGYPHGLKGYQVPLAVRIVRVADVFDALTTDRSYRQAIPFDRALEMIESLAGVKFDPDVVRAFRATLGSVPGELPPLDSLVRLTAS